MRRGNDARRRGSHVWRWTLTPWTRTTPGSVIIIIIIHTHTRLTALCPGLPGWAGTRKVKTILILLEQETVSGSGISWTICKAAPRSRQITTPAHRLDALSATQPTVSKHWRLDHHHHRHCKDHCSGGEIMTRKKKHNSESNSFVAAAEQVCLQPVLEHLQRRGRRNIAGQAIPHLCFCNRKGTTCDSWPTTLGSQSLQVIATSLAATVLEELTCHVGSNSRGWQSHLYLSRAVTQSGNPGQCKAEWS